MTHREKGGEDDRRKHRFDGCMAKHNCDAVLNWAYYCNWLYCNSRNLADAEDATAEAFLRLWQHLDTVVVGKERSWLMTTVRNILRNRRRYRDRHPEESADAPMASGDTLLERQKDSNSHSDPVVVAEWNDQIKALRDCIKTLSEDRREVVNLRLEGVLEEVIAQMVGIPLNTVKSRYYLAKRQIGRCLQDKGHSYGRA